MMRRLLAVCVLIAASAPGVFAQSSVFLVRHAERADSGTAAATMTGADPDLSGAGRLRAEALAKMLKDAKITAIYTTEYKRTKQTAEPLATMLGVLVTAVPSKDVTALAQKLKTATANVLVVGHSNTVPEIIKALGVAEPVAIGENDFDNLLIVSGGSLIRLHY
jgi:2,3-bisphosphoglycerate-dependent phosphoglycerate mutase